MALQLSDTMPFVTTDTLSRPDLLKLLDISEDDFQSVNPHADDLEVFEPRIPLNVPAAAIGALDVADRSLRAGKAPIDWAIREWKKGVVEYTASGQSNPEVEKYHQSTGGVAPDDVSWCSSFVNWCVERAGMAGTDNKVARSWHKWGKATTKPERGDIVVFRRKDSNWQGHVGFFWEDAGNHVQVLGGNQSNAVQISSYPKNGSVYALLSYRKVR